MVDILIPQKIYKYIDEDSEEEDILVFIEKKVFGSNIHCVFLNLKNRKIYHFPENCEDYLEDISKDEVMKKYPQYFI